MLDPSRWENLREIGKMRYKLSGNLPIRSPRAREAANLHKTVLGLEVHEEGGSATGFLTNGRYLYFAEVDGPRVVYEFLVPDLEEARRELEAKGCEVVVWKGRGGDCYMQDPFGNLFNR